MRLSVSLVLLLALVFCGLNQAAAKADKKKRKNVPADDPNTPKLNVPIPVNHSAEGVVVPVFNEQGKLQMNFKMDLATRTDIGHLQMTQAKVETFDDDGKSEMKIDMPRSVLDLNTKIITSDTTVTIRRADFEVTGERMRFNTDTRAGVMLGKVRMLIYNHDEISAENKNE